jgi:hypothetical protein
MLIISGFEFRIMSWKEFLKPSMGKIILFVLFVVAMIFLPLCGYVGSCALPPSPCPSSLSILQVVMMNNPWYWGIMMSCSLYLIFALLISFYLLSCLIIRIYNKSKKK